MGKIHWKQGCKDMKAKYRSKLEMYMDILDKCQDELIHSEISRKCNISHYDATAHLAVLTDLGVLRKTEVPGTYLHKDIVKQRYAWKITPEGLQWLRKLEETHDFFTIKVLNY